MSAFRTVHPVKLAQFFALIGFDLCPGLLFLAFTFATCRRGKKWPGPVAGTVFSFFIFMTYHFIETIQASSEIGVVLCICLQFLYRHGGG